MGQNFPQLIMYASLEALPPLELPEGIAIRTFIEGDEAHWNAIIRTSFNNPWFNFDSFIRPCPQFTPERIFFAEVDGVPAATAIAWNEDRYPADTGYVHMVGGLPEYKGRGLGYWVNLAVLHRLKSEGYTRVVLQTDDFRLPAIKTYLKLGFQIDLTTHESIPARWDAISYMLSQGGKPAVQLKLCEYGKPLYRIVIPREHTPALRYAAEELSNFLFRATNTAFPIGFDDSESAMPEIVLGSATRHNSVKLDLSTLKNDGFIIKADCADILIAGKTERGTLYGVYTFLEQFAGIRFISYDYTHIPAVDCLTVPSDTNIRQEPPLEYRDIYYREIIANPDFSARRKCNGFHGGLTEKHGGKFVYAGFVHTFDSIVPPNQYFDEHPEYFSMVDGRRIKERSQLCLTNPEVLELAKKYVRDILEKNPKVNILSVSQNDWYNPCECEHCHRIDEEEASHAGTLIRFVNAVADSIRDDYPEVIIDTLAYQYTRACPKLTKPRPNVAIRLCTIECCFSHSLTDCNKTGALEDFGRKHNIMDDFDEWAKVSNRLYVWDYVTDFCHYLLPHPNLHVLKDNLNFFIDHNVVGLFEQGCGDTLNSDMGALRAYVLSKLMWNPMEDLDELTNEFLRHYYGRAHKIIRAYIDLFAREACEKNICVGCFAHPDNAIYSDELMAKAEALVSQAIAAAKHEPELIRKHVDIFALGLEYYRLWQTRSANIPEKVDHFIRRCADLGMTHIREWNYMTLFEDQPQRQYLLGRE